MRPCSNRRSKGNRFLLSTFDGSSIARDWTRKLDAFFLLHQVEEREAMEIAALHLEGKKKILWFSHLSHARVTDFANFTQRVIKKFGKKKSKEEESSPPLEETCTSADTTMEEQPSSLAIGGANTLEEGTLAVIQDVPKFHQGMPNFPSPIVLANTIEGCIPLHVVNVEQ